jgi:thiopurine S-methyltransferase
MEAEYWKNRWKNNEIGFNQARPNALLINNIDYLALQKGATVFVPLCGKSVDMHWLTEQGYKVIGVELSEIACREYFQERSIVPEIDETASFKVFKTANITLYAGDFFQLTADMLSNVHAIYDRAALIALPADMREHYAALIKQHLFNASMLLITVTYENKRDQAPYSIGPQLVEQLYSECYQIEQLAESADTVNTQNLIQRDFDNPVDHVFLLKPKIHKNH